MEARVLGTNTTKTHHVNKSITRLATLFCTDDETNKPNAINRHRYKIAIMKIIHKRIHTSTPRSMSLDIEITNRFINIARVNGMLILTNAPKNLPINTVCRGTEFDNINRSVPRSRSLEIESKVNRIAIRLRTYPITNPQSTLTVSGRILNTLGNAPG